MKTHGQRNGRALAIALAVAALVAAGAQAQDGVVARVDGQDITEADLAIAQGMYGGQLDSMPEDARRSMMVDALVEVRLMAEAARAEGIDRDPEFKRRMDFLETQTLRTILLQRRLAATVTDAAVRAAYDRQLAAMPTIGEARFRHILLGTEAEAQAVVDALAAGGDFSALARERSLDGASKEGGGDLGFRAQGQSLPEIDAEVAKLKPGEHSLTPVRSAFGFHVVKVEEKRDRPAPAFETVAPQIRQSLEDAAERRIASELKAAAKVEKLIPDVAPPAGEDGHDH